MQYSRRCVAVRKRWLGSGAGANPWPSQNITVPVACHLYPSATWECVSVTSTEGITRTPKRRLLFMFYSKILLVNLMYAKQPTISIEFLLVFFCNVVQCLYLSVSLLKNILTRDGRTLFSQGKFQVVHSAECFIKILFCYTNACYQPISSFIVGTKCSAVVF